MNNILYKYLLKKSAEILDYTKQINHIFSYSTQVNIENESKIVAEILEIYFRDYYMMENCDYSLVSKYYNFDGETDDLFKSIIASIVVYFENKKINLLANNNNVMFLAYSIYFACLLEKIRENFIQAKKKLNYLDDIAKKISESFVCKSGKKPKEYVSKLVKLMNKYIKDDLKLFEELDEIQKEESNNEYVLINEKARIYKIKYNFSIEELKSLETNYIDAVLCDQDNIKNDLTLISLELALVDLLKQIKTKEDKKYLLKLDKIFYKKKIYTSKIIKLLNSEYSKSNIGILIDSKEYSLNDNIEDLKKNGIMIYIEIKDKIDNINIDKDMCLIANSKIINENKTYIESLGIKYIIFDQNELNVNNQFNINDIEFVEFKEANNEQ